MRFLQAVVALVILLGWAGPTHAQSLGDVANKEKQKRQGKPAPKVITESDLGRSPKRGTVSMSGELPAETGEAPAEAAPAPEGGTVSEGEAASGEVATGGTEGQAEGGEAAAKPGAKKEKTEDEIRAEQRAQWQKKLDIARENVRAHQTNVDNIQRDLNDLTGGVFTERRNQVLKMLDDEKAKLAAAQATLTQLEEEGRRAGWPR
jgi:hypothetical protein